MTSFERHFSALRKVLGEDDLYDIWPDFNPQYDEYEYAWTTIRGLGEALLLNCGQCDGPSDMRHIQCKNCVDKRGHIAKDAFQRATSRPRDNWSTIILCRIHQG
jgi:hypothetical protein